MSERTDQQVPAEPLAGVRIADEVAADAVAGDEGPEHPGVRRSS